MLFYCILRYIAIQQSAVCYTVCEVNSVYKRIRELREDADLTQKEVSKILHCSQQVYSNYELGQRDIPTVVLICLAKHYHTSTDYILGLTDNKDLPNYTHN